MSGNVTLLSLREDAKDRADMTNSRRISDAQWNSYINKSKDKLYDLLIKAYDSDYYTTSTTFSVTANIDTYALPSDFYKTVLLEYVVDAYHSYPLKKFSFMEKNRSIYPTGYNRYGNYLRYREVADNLIFHPVPIVNCTLKLWYIPRATNLVADNDELKGFNGWEEFIIIDAAIKAGRNEETDTGDLEKDLMDITLRLNEMAENRNISSGAKIQNTEKHRSLNEIQFGDWE